VEYFGGRRYPGKTNAGERPFVFQDATAQSILWSKIPYFFRAIVVLGSVSLPRLNTPRKLSVKQQTMSGLSGSTYLHKSPKIVCSLRTASAGVLQTWKDTDHRKGNGRTD
jgi:hypothetical protein